MEITASEVMGELRKVARQYEVFKRVEEMLQVLVDYEQRKAALVKEIEVLQKEQARLDSKMDEAVKRANELNKAAEQTFVMANEKAKHVEAKAADVLAKAKADAAALKQMQEVEVAKMKVQIDELKKDAVKANQEAVQAQAARDAMVFDFQQKRNELLKAFS